jgi:hypothetical protein
MLRGIWRYSHNVNDDKIARAFGATLSPPNKGINLEISINPRIMPQSNRMHPIHIVMLFFLI